MDLIVVDYKGEVLEDCINLNSFDAIVKADVITFNGEQYQYSKHHVDLDSEYIAVTVHKIRKPLMTYSAVKN